MQVVRQNVFYLRALAWNQRCFIYERNNKFFPCAVSKSKFTPIKRGSSELAIKINKRTLQVHVMKPNSEHKLLLSHSQNELMFSRILCHPRSFLLKWTRVNLKLFHLQHTKIHTTVVACNVITKIQSGFFPQHCERVNLMGFNGSICMV